MIHIIYKSRIVSPKMEKPVQDKYKTTPELGGGYRVTDWLSFDTALLEYEQHLESLWPDGIECSPELLEKFKDGDEVIEGKDYQLERRPVCHGRHSTMGEFAVPVQSDAVEEGEDEMWKDIKRRLWLSFDQEKEVKNLKAKYKLIKK